MLANNSLPDHAGESAAYHSADDLLLSDNEGDTQPSAAMCENEEIEVQRTQSPAVAETSNAIQSGNATHQTVMDHTFSTNKEGAVYSELN